MNTKRWKFCPDCGHSLATEWKHCAECGIEIGAVIQIVAQPQVAVLMPINPFPQIWHPPVITWGDGHTVTGGNS